MFLNFFKFCFPQYKIVTKNNNSNITKKIKEEEEKSLIIKKENWEKREKNRTSVFDESSSWVVARLRDPS